MSEDDLPVHVLSLNTRQICFRQLFDLASKLCRGVRDDHFQFVFLEPTENLTAVGELFTSRRQEKERLDRRFFAPTFTKMKK